SGAGKSTLLKLLTRDMDTQEGKILIDGINIRVMTQESLHTAISLVPQEPNLFHRSLLDNIRYIRPDSSFIEVKQAALAARCEGFIEQLALGYDTLVGERGIKLSGGQRQRVAIARAFLRNSQVLVLDEATSSLDSESEKYIQEALHSLMQGRTTIVVAHRLSTIKEMDRIIVIRDGVIAEEGTHEYLLSLQGEYARYWHIQSGGFILNGIAASV
ncbi:MAG: ATP-binding cassette domain-containing protein, partial [bacterium]|nr:ATP-binding cassette domain-containing protein [bacterium]